MKFSTIFVAVAAFACASVSAQSGAGEVKGVPLVFDAPVSLRQATFIKGDAIIHSRSEDLATSNVAVPDASNPYIKVKGTGSNGIVGTALSVESEGSSTDKSDSSAWTIVLAAGGCAVAAVGIAGFVFMKKRQQKREEESDLDAKTPASDSPLDEIVEYKNDMQTPV